MTVFTCEDDWEAKLCCIYMAFASKKGHKNIRLLVEPIEQLTLFDEYIHVDRDYVIAKRVMDAINMKISQDFYYSLLRCSMSCEEDALDIIYRMLILGFAYGPQVVEMRQYEAVNRFFEICRRYGNEAHLFLEFVRFHRIEGNVYVAHIEPHSHVVVPVGNHFADRMPSENWMIIDDTHREAVVHPKDGDNYVRLLNDEEFYRLLDSEKYNDEYTDLWKVFFDTIEIKQRHNKRCQQNLFPEWMRKHAVEFTNNANMRT